ncbi:transcriptional regulator [Candidatus Peribacteria bacterium RIFCSPLOWO2_02_FULL_51_10]|nr:MAG: transcriptional regulator [Candidatus Peribacteria bacterium RIFCSPHIGHO2_02_FULL_51_15]OGJ68457.1 MAG: transcriptional regulator [Candidatus Peribacteria bacterium RIFCSPLOWO2_02_FULL_51_10]
MSKRFGKRLREARLRVGLSQEELAAKARLHRTYVGMIERAKRNITLSNAESLAKALGMKLFELIRDL